ncbi:MAG: hypothetical protein AB1736_08470 [Chloroflexota bacterium]
MSVLANRAWGLLFVTGSVLLFGGLVQLVADRPVASGLIGIVQRNLGLSWNGLVAQSPETAIAILGFQRMLALFIIAFSLLVLSVVLTAYRRGERWAWVTMWLNLVVLGGIAAVATAYGGWETEPSRDPGVLGIAILSTLVLLGLFLPFRTFFPKRVADATDSRPPTA